MQSWKKLEVFVADYLGWKRLTKKHYGDSKPDVEGDGFRGDAKHYKKHRIHTIKKEMDVKYKDDIIIFTKEKGTHYDPRNVLVVVNLELFNSLLKCKRIAEKVDIDNKDVKSVDNMLTNNLNSLTYYLEQVKLLTNKMKKIIKEIENENKNM